MTSPEESRRLFDDAVRHLAEANPELASALESLNHKSESANQSNPSIHQPTVPDFELIRVLGKGGFGVVWLARNVHDHHLYALKILLPGRSELTSLREYKKRAASNPFLISISHIGRTGDSFYYVMRLADNSYSATIVEAVGYEPMTLRRYLDRVGKLSAEEVSQISRRLLLGLEHLHLQGAAHCDVKPENILRIDQTWQLGDPGLISEIEGEQGFGGTRQFLPPQADTDGIDRDLYALGVTVAAMLPKEAGSKDPAYHRLHACVQKACNVEVDQRFRSAREMYEFLEPTKKHWYRFASLVAIATCIVAWTILPSALQFPSSTNRPAVNTTRGKLSRVIDARIELYGPPIDQANTREFLGVLGRPAFFGMELGQFTVDVTLSAPVASGCVLLDPDGQVTWGPRTDGREELPVSDRLQFPDPESGNRYGFGKSTGAQVILIVESRKGSAGSMNGLVGRLEGVWSAELGFEPGRILSFDGARYSELVDPTRGRIEPGPVIPDWWRKIIAEVSLTDHYRVLAAWAFVVSPAGETN